MKKIPMTALPSVLVVVLVAAAFVNSGCSPKTFERIIKETDTVKVTETLIVKDRLDTVFVDVPSSSQEVVVNDTTSHLEDDLYESDARWDGKNLHHSMKSKPGAKVRGVVVVHDTIKVKEKEEKHDKSSQETKTVYVKPMLKDKAGYFGAGLGVAIIIAVLYGARKKIKRIYERIGI